MGLRMTINSAVAFSLGLLFLALVGCAVVFFVGLFRLIREGRQEPGLTWIAASLSVGLLVIAVTPLARPAVGLLARWTAVGGSPAITSAKYEAIRSGMTYDEVKKLLGGEGVEFTHSEQPSYAVIVYQWDNPDGSYVQVTTNNGVVNNKMQYGLSE